MHKKIFILLIILFVLFICGCTFKTTADKTWGEKEPVKVSDLFVSNSTGDHFDNNGTNYYYVWGYIGNKAQKPASNVIILTKVFTENGTLYSNNTTTPYQPKNIPSEGKSYFFVAFKDPNNQITNYTIELSMK